MPSISKQTPGKTVTKPMPKGGIFSKLQDIDEGLGDWMRAVIYGRSGSGKTTFWATAPAPILAVLCSGGLQPGELKSIDTPENKKRIKKWVLNDPNELTQICKEQRETQYFKTIVLDHGSGFQDVVLKGILGLDEIPVQRSWGLATQGQWGQCGVQCMEYFRPLLSLPCHTLIVAHEREFDNNSDNEMVVPYVGAALTPKLAGWLNGACDYVMQCYIRNKFKETVTKVGTQEVITKTKLPGVEYCMRVGADATFMTKFRMPKGQKVLPDTIVNPTFDSIMGVIKKGQA